jgi:hypothetical protein
MSGRQSFHDGVLPSEILSRKFSLTAVSASSDCNRPTDSPAVDRRHEARLSATKLLQCGVT